MTRYAVTRRFDGTVYVHDFEYRESEGPFSLRAAIRRCNEQTQADQVARSLLYLRLFGRKAFQDRGVNHE